jgi:hypothetical protein
LHRGPHSPARLEGAAADLRPVLGCSGRLRPECHLGRAGKSTLALQVLSACNPKLRVTFRGHSYSQVDPSTIGSVSCRGLLPTMPRGRCDAITASASADTRPVVVRMPSKILESCEYAGVRRKRPLSEIDAHARWRDDLSGRRLARIMTDGRLHRFLPPQPLSIGGTAREHPGHGSDPEESSPHGSAPRGKSGERFAALPFQ